MSHPACLRDRARELRIERRLTIDEIAERLALPRTTVFYWVRDPPIARRPVATSRRRSYAIQYHADQHLAALRAFWAGTLGIVGSEIRMQRKSNSNQLAGRTWRSEHGVLAVAVNDTLLRARMSAWMDSLREGWP